MTDRDKISNEIDRRKLQKLVDDEMISAEELANAPIYIICPNCGAEELAVNDVCPKCEVSYD